MLHPVATRHSRHPRSRLTNPLPFSSRSLADEASKLEHEGPGTSSAVTLLVILKDFTNLRLDQGTA